MDFETSNMSLQMESKDNLKLVLVRNKDRLVKVPMTTEESQLYMEQSVGELCNDRIMLACSENSVAHVRSPLVPKAPKAGADSTV